MSGIGGLRRALLPLLLISALAPLALLLVASVGHRWFAPDLLPGSYSLESWRSLFQGGRLPIALGTSFALATATGLFSVAIGAPIGHGLAGLSGWRRHLGTAAAFLPVAVPPIALGIGLQISVLTLGVSGTWAGVLLGHLVPAAGYATLYFLGIFTVFDRGVEEEARSLGATTLTIARRVTMPMLRRQLLDGFLLGFVVSWTQVALTLVLGQGNVRTLPLEVFAYIQAGQDRYAATGALLLVLPPLVTIGLVKLAARRAGVVPL